MPENNDLSEAVDLFNQFKGAKESFKTDSKRCKTIPIEEFKPENNWIIDNFWKKEEKINLGIIEEENKVKISEFSSMLNEVSNNINQFMQEVNSINEGKEAKFREVLIPDIFDIHLGSAKYNHRYFSTHKGQFPVYSGQTKNKGIIAKIDSFDHDKEGLTWTIDGYAGRVFYRKGKFSLTCHCGLLTLKKEVKDKLDYEFLKYLLDNELPNHSVGEGNKRLKKTHIEKIKIKIPVNKNGEYDLIKQKEIAEKYKLIEQIKKEFKEEFEKVYSSSVEFS